jgi:hypothetical protein
MVGVSSALGLTPLLQERKVVTPAVAEGSNEVLLDLLRPTSTLEQKLQGLHSNDEGERSSCCAGGERQSDEREEESVGPPVDG